MKWIEAIFVCAVIAAGIIFFSLRAHAFEPMVRRAEVVELVKACITEQIDQCGDAICEGDPEFESVIFGSGNAVLECLSEPSFVGPEYFDPKNQRRILRQSKLGWWWR